MFGIGTTELMVIFIVAIIVIGPTKLPELAKTLGKAMGEFKRVSNDVKSTIETEMDSEAEKKETAKAKKEIETKKSSGNNKEAESANADSENESVRHEVKSEGNGPHV